MKKTKELKPEEVVGQPDSNKIYETLETEMVIIS
jgi:hypothetical protein